MQNKTLIVVAAVVLAFVLATPVSALVAGAMWFVAPATFAFWPTFGYATLGCGVFNALVSWPRIKATFRWAAS